MHEYNGNSSSFTMGSTPKVKKVTTTVCEYDEKGNLVKETITETEYTDNGYYYQPVPYQPYVTYTTNANTGGGSSK